VVDRSADLDAPDAVVQIVQRLEDRGYETWAVGGAVRDALLGGSRYDWDLATSAHPDVVRKLFKPSYPIGIQFGTVAVRGIDGNIYEVTTFRRDIETDGRHAVVEYAEELDEDLARRDFTINAIAYHPLRKELHDPYAGQDDLDQRTLRCVGEPALRFAEDYLRVVRGLRFAGRYQLSIDDGTWKALIEAVPNLTRLSGERIREELLKVLSARSAAPGLALYRESGALGVVYPELNGVADEEWARILRAIDGIGERRTALRLAELFGPAGPHIEEMMTRLRFSNAEIRKVTALAKALAAPLPAAGDVVGGRRWLREVGRERAADVLRLQFAGARARRAPPMERTELAVQARVVLDVLGSGDPVAIGELAIDGNDLKTLGLQPGPEYSRILESCLDAVIDDPELNDRERLLEHVREQM
jgi:tRNA nucleotidyltransferase (CCA-adding enzyme)